MKKILTAEAATIIGTSPQFVRIAMQDKPCMHGVKSILTFLTP